MSTKVKRCYNKAACKGSGSESIGEIGVGESINMTHYSSTRMYCEEGYKGPYCDVCDKGYSGSFGSCRKCKREGTAASVAWTMTLIAITIVILFLLARMVSNFSKKSKKVSEAKSNARSERRI